MESNSVLNQEEIDALMGRSSSDTPAAPPPTPVNDVSQFASPPVEAPVASPPPPPPIASAPPPAPVISAPPPVAPVPAAPLPGPSQAELAGLTDRIARLEQVVGRISQLEGALSESRVVIQRMQQQFQQLAEHARGLGGQVQSVVTALKNTPGFNAHQMFVCDGCGTRGQVAIPLRCAHCGKQAWRGRQAPKQR